MEGVQGWMAEIEKKQERTSRVGGIAVLLAIAAAGGALALGILNKQDAATQDDIDELTEKVNALGASVERQTESQLKAINQRLATVEQQIASLNQRQRQTESQIEKLQTASAAAAAAPPADTGTDAGTDATEKP
jgi:cell division protein FtsB